MKYRKMQGIKLSYRRQGLIYFNLLCYDELPAEQRRRIDKKIHDVCQKAGEYYEAALRAFVLKGDSIQKVCLEHYVRANTIYDLRKKLYESW